MPRTFAGWAAEHHRRYRRDVPGVVVDDLVGRLGLGPDDMAVDRGAGTGQLAVPLARREGTVLEIDPEPNMLALLRERSDEEGVWTLLCVLGTDRELAVLADVLRPVAARWSPSSMPEDMVPADRRSLFETGVRRALEPFEPGPLIEDVPVTVLLGRARH